MNRPFSPRIFFFCDIIFYEVAADSQFGPKTTADNQLSLAILTKNGL